jgi:hypothetical protein
MASTLVEPVVFASVAIVTDSDELLQMILKRTGTEWSWGGWKIESRSVDVKWVGARKRTEERKKLADSRSFSLFGSTPGGQRGIEEKKILLVRKQSGLPIGMDDCRIHSGFGQEQPLASQATSHQPLSF